MPRRRKRIFVIAGSIVLLFALVVILIPTFVNMGLGRGAITNAIASNVNGSASIGDLRVGWFGDQEAKGVVIKDETGRKAANVNVLVHAGLLSLALGTVDDLQIDVNGELVGELREDGSTSFGELFGGSGDGAGKKKDGAAPKPKKDKKAEPLSLEGVPKTSIAVSELRVTLDLRQASGVETLTIPKLVGNVDYRPGGELVVGFEGDAESDGRKGSVKIDVRGADLVDADGRITPAGANVDATVTLTQLPMPFDERVEAIERLELKARARDLAKRLDISVELEAKQKDGETSGLEGAVVVLEPFAADGTPTFALDRMEGDVTGSRVPTALLQPFLADTPVLLSRDIGPSVDVTARVSSGTSREIVVDLEGANASLDVKATLEEDGAIVGQHLKASVNVAPALVGDVIESPARVELDATSFRVPAANAEGERPLGAMAIDAVIRMTDSTRVQSAAGPDARTLPVGDLVLNIRADSLAEGVAINGGFAVAGGRVEIAETLTNLLDDEGNLALAGATPVGSITATDLDGLALVALLPEPATADLAAHLLDGSVGAKLTSSATKDGMRAALELRGAALRADATAVRGSNALAVETATLTIEATPALLAALQEASEEPVVLRAPTTIGVTLDPFTLPGASFEDYAMPTEAIRGTATLDDARVEHGALDEVIVLSAITADVTASLGAAPSYAAKGTAQIYRRAKGAPLGAVSFDLTAVTQDDALVPGGTITVSDLAVEQLERVLGMEKNDLGDWLGDSGTLAVDLGGSTSSQSATLRSDFPNLSGELTASIDEESIVLASSGLDLTLRRATLEGLLNPEDAESAEAGAAAAPVTVAADMPMRITLPSLRLPRTLLAGEPFVPAAVVAAASVTAGPLSLGDDGGVFSTIDGLTGTIDCDDLSKGIHFDLEGQASAPNVTKPGAISIDGRIVNVVAEDETVDFSAAKLHMEATVEHVPTGIADALLGLEGLLVAAAGNEMNATFTSRSFSQRSGQLDARIDTDNGFISGRIKGRKIGLRTTTDDPLRGELNILPPLRERLLTKIHPVLADIRTTENPLRFNVPSNALIPLDGDLSRMKGDIEITIGKVEFDAGSSTLNFLRFFNSGGAGRTTFPGVIEPIVARIRGGVVTYDRFVMQIDKYTLAYEGKIDLVNQRMDLRTELPLAALAQGVKELDGYADKIIVPIVTRGTFEESKTEIDPEFDLAGAALQAGFTGGLNDVLGDKGIKLGDILDNVFKKKGDSDQP